MTIDRNRCFEIIMMLEGGGIVHTVKGDNGGTTKWGISKRAYPNENITKLTKDRAKALFIADYWNVVQGDYLPAPVNLLVADMAFNAGPEAAAKCLQRALGNVKADGVIGPRTLAETNKRPVHELAARVLSQRVIYYSGLDGFARFGTGWINRCGRLMMELTKWAKIQS